MSHLQLRRAWAGNRSAVFLAMGSLCACIALRKRSQVDEEEDYAHCSLRLGECDLAWTKDPRTNNLSNYFRGRIV